MQDDEVRDGAVDDAAVDDAAVDDEDETDFDDGDEADDDEAVDADEADETAAARAREPEPGPVLVADAPPTLNPRQRRARRRRHRRQLGTLLFLAVAGAVLASAYFAVADDDSSDSSTATTALLAPTTTAPFSKQYATTTDVNVRQGPGTRFAAIGAIETGKPVVVTCVAEGEPVEGPAGRDTRWLKVATPSGFVTAIYVAVGDDLRNKKIPVCPA